MNSRVLVIRFSSIGDVLQTLSVVEKLRQEWPEAEIHWLVREDLAELVQMARNPVHIHRVSRIKGLIGLCKLAWSLRAERFTHIYDAHNNLRSHVMCLVLRWWRCPFFVRRPIERWKRLLLFRFRINRFRQPFSGQRDLLLPLQRWGISGELPEPPVMQVPFAVMQSVKKRFEPLADFVALAPSAAYPLKRWPLEHWLQLVNDLPSTQFVVLGGSQDGFLAPLAERPNVHYWVGKLSLVESAAVVAMSRKLVSNDTGLMHMAEQLGVPCVALMGPAPFGFPSRPLTQVLQLDLPCRPCSKHGQGPCTNPVFQECLRGISPQRVRLELDR